METMPLAEPIYQSNVYRAEQKLADPNQQLAVKTGSGVQSLSMAEPVLPEELHWEILRWVPVKTLMRFKCISTNWHSIIIDPSFAKAYCGGFRGLLLHEPCPKPIAPAKMSYFYMFRLNYEGDGHSTCQVSHYSTVKHSDDGEKQATNVVNGLICFNCTNRLLLYNIATRERMELPSAGYQPGYGHERYYLGFDPVTKLYKLLFIKQFRLAGFSNNIHHKCQVLTIGADSFWRDVSPPPAGINSENGYSEGVLYWLACHSRNDLIIAFDFVQEKFRSISLHKPGAPYYLLNCGHMPVMSAWPTYNKGLIVRYNNIKNSAELDAERVWHNEVKFILPSQELNLFPGGILPNGEVIMFPYDNYPFDKFPASLYVFNSIKRETKEMVMEVDTSLASTIMGGASKCWALFQGNYYEENIISLRCLTSTS